MKGPLVADNSPVLWSARDIVEVPATAVTAADIASMAKQLSPRELHQVIQTFDSGLYEMGATFVWTRTMAGLKRQLASLGIDFIAEMLDRPDIRADAEIHEVLTDFDAVRLAEELGMFGSSHALRLRHALETVTHFADPPSDVDDEGMMPEEAIGTLRTCVQTILGHDELGVAVEFAQFRKRLESEVLPDAAPEIEGLANSPYFFKRTVLRVLLAGIKTASGAQLENLLANFNTLLPSLWPGLMDPDRHMLGRGYAELHADGQSKASSGVRSALLKVSGFDYVPENLRSLTFLEAAARVLGAHFGWDNFHTEPAPMRALASLGSSIPIHAFAKCMTAILCVRIGNPYGVSFDAQSHAIRMLENVTRERWAYFFDECLPADDVLLGELTNETVATRWCHVLIDIERVQELSLKKKSSRTFLKASFDGDVAAVQRLARRRSEALR
ncbi:MAG: hypothetical protein QOI95_3085 [Acidimicrobiaceae bacterium]|jgi:hypothetical protein